MQRLTKWLWLVVASSMAACGGRASVPQIRVVAASAPVSEEPGARQKRVAAALVDVEKMVMERVTELNFPGVAAAVLDRGRVIWVRSYGVADLQRRDPVTPRTVFRAGSITKTMTAMATLVLREQGSLDLDVPAVKYLPELGQVGYPTADSPPITLRHLLTHTSGLPRLGRFNYAAERDEAVSEAEVLGALRGLRLKHVPGIVNDYSNLGFSLVGLILQRVTGDPLRQVLAETVLGPLNMSGARWEASAVPANQLATGYHWDGEAYVPRHHWKLGASEAMGGLYATLDDLIRYTAFHMTAWPPGARADAPPLKNAVLRESHLFGSFQRPGNRGAGLGWGVVRLSNAKHVVFHTGATHQYASVVMFSPNGQTAFVAMANTNRAFKPLDKLAGKVIQRLEP